MVTYNGETNTLHSADGGWTLAEDPAYHLDETSCNTMRTALAALNAKRQLTEEPGEDYGFTADSLTVTVTAAGETNTFTFGAENAATGDIYLKKAGDDALYTVAGTKASCFEVRKTDLFGAFNPAGLTSSAIEAVTLTKNGETLTPELTTELLSALSSYVTAQTTDGDPAGMKELAAAVVQTADSTKTLTYYEGMDNYYLTVAGDTSLYTVDGSTVQTILAADAAEADS